MVHKIRGKVVRGNSIGRKLGFPTANIPVAAEMPVQDGVYAAEVRVGGALYRAMVNIGTRPTVGDGAGRFAEANLFGFMAIFTVNRWRYSCSVISDPNAVSPASTSCVGSWPMTDWLL